MAPASCRHTLIWSLPTLALLLTFLWYKSRRGSSRSDPGGTAKGTRKAKKQEEKITSVAPSLLAEGCEKSVKQLIFSTRRKPTASRNRSSTTETVGIELGHQEVQQSEVNTTTKIIEKLTTENTLSTSSTNFSTDTSKIISVGNNSENSFSLTADNSQVDISDTSKQSDGVNVNSESRSSVEENSVSVGGLLAHCDSIGSNCEVETNCEGVVFQVESSESVPNEIGSEIILPPESDLETSVNVETTAEIVVSEPKEIKCEINNYQDTCSEIVPQEAISTETPSEIGVTKETISEVAPQKETIYEVAVEKETNSEIPVPKETNSDAIVLEETVSGVTVPKNTNFEVLASQEVSSDIAVVQETDCEIVATQEVVFEVTLPQTEDSKVVVTQEPISEATVSQDHNPEHTVSETYHSNASKSEEDNLSISSQCSDNSRVSYSNSFAAGSEEAIPVSESNGAEDVPSSSVLAVSCSLTDREIEKDTMPELVREGWTLDKNSDIEAESASETQRKETGQNCEENNECTQNKDSAAAETARMQTPPTVKEVLDEADTAATSTSCGLEGKLAALELGKGRDSANHSPAEVMLASPSASSYSDEGSSDSGKGCSDLATPPSRTPASGSSVSGDATALSVYEFVLPQHLVGRLIGRHGAFVHQIKAKTNASILIKRHPDTQKLKICAVEGTQLDIESALEMIRKKFPLKHYPSITLEQVCFVPPVPMYAVLPECLQLMLVEGVSNDVILSSLVTPGHFFLQQPTHPTFPALNRLNACMNLCYSETNVPLLPTPINPGVICAAPTMGGWYRAQVVSVEPETNVCEVKFVDYGGYLSLEHTALRQIRSDFMTLPFQASECFLANVTPAGGEEASWSADAAAVMEELTHGQVLQAQVCDYTEENVPNVFLYAVHCNQVVLVNQELVLRGLAEWWKPEEVNDVSCL